MNVGGHAGLLHLTDNTDPYQASQKHRLMHLPDTCVLADHYSSWGSTGQGNLLVFVARFLMTTI